MGFHSCDFLRRILSALLYSIWIRLAAGSKSPSDLFTTTTSATSTIPFFIPVIHYNTVISNPPNPLQSYQSNSIQSSPILSVQFYPISKQTSATSTIPFFIPVLHTVQFYPIHPIQSYQVQFYPTISLTKRLLPPRYLSSFLSIFKSIYLFSRTPAVSKRINNSAVFNNYSRILNVYMKMGT